MSLPPQQQQQQQQPTPKQPPSPQELAEAARAIFLSKAIPAFDASSQVYMQVLMEMNQQIVYLRGELDKLGWKPPVQAPQPQPP